MSLPLPNTWRQGVLGTAVAPFTGAAPPWPLPAWLPPSPLHQLYQKSWGSSSGSWETLRVPGLEVKALSCSPSNNGLVHAAQSGTVGHPARGREKWALWVSRGGIPFPVWLLGGRRGTRRGRSFYKMPQISLLRVEVMSGGWPSGNEMLRPRGWTPIFLTRELRVVHTHSGGSRGSYKSLRFNK